MFESLEITKNRAIELIRPLARVGDGDTLTEEALLNRFALVCFSNLVEPGDRVAKELCWQFGEHIALDKVARATLGEKQIAIEGLVKPTLLQQQDLNSAIERWKPRFSLKQFRNSFEWLTKLQCGILTDSDNAWPIGLNELEFHAPLALYSLGKQGLDANGRGVAMVGSRAISPYGRWVTKELSETLVEANRPVISGGAFGVDAVAHQSTLNAGGATVAIMAGGLDQFYPRGNIPMIREISERGLVLAEVPPGFTPTKWRFLQRNRLIAAMSSATVVVEAGYRSGSINTANHAASLGRGVGAVPGSINSPSSQGCHELIRSGKASLVASPKHLLELLSNETVVEEFEPRLSADETRVLDALGGSVCSEEVIAKRSGMSVSHLRLTLAQLELEGLVVRKNLKWARISRNL